MLDFFVCTVGVRTLFLLIKAGCAVPESFFCICEISRQVVSEFDEMLLSCVGAHTLRTKLIGKSKFDDCFLYFALV